MTKDICENCGHTRDYHAKEGNHDMCFHKSRFKNRAKKGQFCSCKTFTPRKDNQELSNEEIIERVLNQLPDKTANRNRTLWDKGIIESCIKKALSLRDEEISSKLADFEKKLDEMDTQVDNANDHISRRKIKNLFREEVLGNV